MVVFPLAAPSTLFLSRQHLLTIHCTVCIPMAMECVRSIVTSYCRMFNRDLPLVGPLTAIPEMFHFIASASGLCAFPKVIFFHL